MRRKLTPHGPSSMTVSLPSSWIKQNNLKKGEELEVTEEDNSILIKPVTITQDIKSTETSFIDLDKDIGEDIILTLHKKGYDEIKILVDNPDKIKEIHAFLNNKQLGFEIIKQEQNSIIIRNISNPETEQFNSLFRRVFRITIEYANRIEIIMQNKEEMTHSCVLHEVSINRISNYCKRIIIKDRCKNACFFYAIIEELNNITRNLTLLLNEIMNMEEIIPKNVVMKYSEVTNILIQVYELYYKFSIEEYSNIKRNLETAKRSITKLRTKEASETSCLDNMELIREEIENLLESTLAIQF
jgi:phosphate uptake regulator